MRIFKRLIQSEQSVDYADLPPTAQAAFDATFVEADKTFVQMDKVFEQMDRLFASVRKL